MKIITSAVLTVGCGEDEVEKQKRIQAQQEQQIKQLQQQQVSSQQEYNQQLMQLQQQQMMNQNVMQQAPASGQPVIINNTTPQPVQQHSGDGTSNALLGMAAGAAIGAIGANMMNDNDRGNNGTHTIEKHYIDRSPQESVIPQPIQPTQNLNAQSVSVPSNQVQAKSEKNAMDMNKLAESAKYVPPSQQIGTNVTNVGAANKMDMSKLNTAQSQIQPQQKPIQRMDMSKLNAQSVAKTSSIGGALNKSTGRVNFKK